MDQLEAGARIETNDQKKIHKDFALVEEDRYGYATHGEGRPGHTECVVMINDNVLVIA